PVIVPADLYRGRIGDGRLDRLGRKRRRDLRLRRGRRSRGRTRRSRRRHVRFPLRGRRSWGRADRLYAGPGGRFGRGPRRFAQCELGRILEPAVATLGTAHRATFGADRTVGHDVTRRAGWAGDDHFSGFPRLGGRPQQDSGRRRPGGTWLFSTSIRGYT